MPDLTAHMNQNFTLLLPSSPEMVQPSKFSALERSLFLDGLVTVILLWIFDQMILDDLGKQLFKRRRQELQFELQLDYNLPWSKRQR